METTGQKIGRTILLVVGLVALGIVLVVALRVREFLAQHAALNVIYFASFFVALPAWALVILAPRGKMTRNMMRSGVVLIILAVLYAFVLIGALISQIGQGAFDVSTTERLAILLSSPAAALVFWLHVMTVDLAAAFWIIGESDRIEIGNGVLRFLLIITLFVAPIGIFFFVLWRRLRDVARQFGVAGSGNRNLTAR